MAPTRPAQAHRRSALAASTPWPWLSSVSVERCGGSLQPGPLRRSSVHTSSSMHGGAAPSSAARSPSQRRGQQECRPLKPSPKGHTQKRKRLRDAWVVVVVVVRTECCTCMSVHTRTRMQLIKMDQCQCTGPFGWTDQPETPYVCSLRTHPTPRRGKILRGTPTLSFGGRGAHSFPSSQRWMPWVRITRNLCNWTCLSG